MTESGSRKTRQKEAIRRVLTEARRPLSLEQILQRARTHAAKLGERTVFRHLREMTDDHILVKVYYPGQPPRYELPMGGHHPHFICHDCSQVFVLPGETPDLSASYPAPANLRLQGEEVVFFGQCVKSHCPYEAEKKALGIDTESDENIEHARVPFPRT